MWNLLTTKTLERHKDPVKNVVMLTFGKTQKILFF